MKVFPFYLVGLFWLVMAVFSPDLTPGGEWFTDIISTRPGLSKPTIGLIMLAAMLFVIFIGFPISFYTYFPRFRFWDLGIQFQINYIASYIEYKLYYVE